MVALASVLCIEDGVGIGVDGGVGVVIECGVGVLIECRVGVDGGVGVSFGS